MHFMFLSIQMLEKLLLFNVYVEFIEVWTKAAFGAHDFSGTLEVLFPFYTCWWFMFGNGWQDSLCFYLFLVSNESFIEQHKRKYIEEWDLQLEDTWARSIGPIWNCSFGIWNSWNIFGSRGEGCSKELFLRNMFCFFEWLCVALEHGKTCCFYDIYFF